MDTKQIKKLPVYKKTFEKRSKLSGDLQGVTSVAITPWSFLNEKNGKLSTGYSLSIRVEKLGYGSRSSTQRSIILDASDVDLRKALFEAYQELDKINR